MPRPPAPGPIVAPNTGEVKLYWIIAGVTTTNVLHCSYTGGTPPADSLAEALFSGFKTQLTGSGFLAFLDPGTIFDKTSFRDLRNANQPEYTSSGTGLPGSGTLGPLPSSVALVTTITTAQAGRGYRGRIYFGGLAADAREDARTFSAPAGVAALSFVDGIMSTLTTNSMPLGVLQRALLAGQDSHGNPLPARAASLIAATGAQLSDHRFDSQRRRLGR